MAYLTIPQILQCYDKSSALKATLWGIAHAAISAFLLNYFSGTVGESPIWLPAGIGLGVLILLGHQYWPFIFIGATIGEMGGGHDLLMAMKIAGGAVFGFLLAIFLLNKFTKFNSHLESIPDYLRLIAASFIAAVISTSINTQFLLFASIISAENLKPVFIKWLTGDFFGMAFITPVLLVFQGDWYRAWSRRRVIFLTVSLIVASLVGQAIFFGWFKDFVNLTNRGNLYFFIVTFIAIYFGRQGAMLLFSIATVQSILSVFGGVGFFGSDLMTRPGPTPMWVYLAIICTFGLAVSFAVDRFKRKNDELVVAALILEKSEKRLKGIVSSIPVLMATYDTKLQITDYVNPYFTKVLGYQVDDFTKPNAWWEIAYPDPVYRKEVEVEWNRRAEGSQNRDEPFIPYETKTTCKDGSIKLIGWGCFFVADHIVIYGVDVTEQRYAEEVLKVTSAVYRAMGESVIIKDAHGDILMVNDAFTQLTDFKSEDLLGKPFQSILVKRHGASSYSDIYTSIEAMGRWEGQAWIATKSGEGSLRFVSIYSTFDQNGLPLQRVALISEVTDQRKARELINQQANFDPLTGLPNRRLMFDRLEQLIKQSARANKGIAIAYIDLDNFKDVNDSRGHDFGDQLLIAIAARLRSEVRETDTVARIGGDEFVILLGDLERPEVADIIIQGVVKRLADPIMVQDQMVFVTASVGVSMYPNDGSDGKALLLGADQAMYAAKAQGRNNYHYFTPSLQIKATYRARVISELRTALEKGQFQLYFQPIVNLKSGEVCHAEALIRWHRSNGEVVPPASFIEIAEESGLIIEIGDWVWQEALRFFSLLDRPPGFTLAINVSASQFNSNQHSAKNWLELLSKYQISPSSIVLEITERMMLIQSQRVLRKIAMLQESGCKFSVDDFGTGYSSLSSLKAFNFDYIKIDANFIKLLKPGSQDAALVFAMVSMAKGLGLATIAEGVESAEQAQILHGMNCEYAQGYLYSKPLPAAEFQKLLKDQAGSP